MLLLRVGRKARWDADRRADDPRHVAEAALDLTLSPDERGLSVYRVEGGDDSREVALRYALTYREKLAHMDYLVFPSALAISLGLTVQAIPTQGLDLQLNLRHHEIIGLTPALELRLAAAILAFGERLIVRIRDRDLLKLGTELCRRDPELKRSLRGDWAAKLAPLRDDPTS
jgi:hypothetical protein